MEEIKIEFRRLLADTATHLEAEAALLRMTIKARERKPKEVRPC